MKILHQPPTVKTMLKQTKRIMKRLQLDNFNTLYYIKKLKQYINTNTLCMNFDCITFSLPHEWNKIQQIRVE